MCIKTWQESAKRTEPRSFQWCLATVQEAVGTNWGTGRFLWTSGSTSLLRGWLSPGTGCPERLWSLSPWRYWKAVWTWSWATGSRQPCSIWEAGADDLQRAFPTSVILWYNDTLHYLRVTLLLTATVQVKWFAWLQHIRKPDSRKN